MPRDFFKHLAVYTILKKREFPQSKLLPSMRRRPQSARCAGDESTGEIDGETPSSRKPPTVKVLEAGVVGSLDYKIIEAEPGRRPLPVAQGQQVQLLRR